MVDYDLDDYNPPYLGFSDHPRDYFYISIKGQTTMPSGLDQIHFALDDTPHDGLVRLGYMQYPGAWQHSLSWRRGGCTC